MCPLVKSRGDDSHLFVRTCIFLCYDNMILTNLCYDNKYLYVMICMLDKLVVTE